MIDVDLDGRTALVTGSAEGLGRAVVLACAERGADVAVHYHSSEAEAEATAEDARERGANATTVQGDVTDPDEVDGVFDAVADDLDDPDVLVNNVGDFEPTHWADIPVEDWRRVMETNLLATALCSKRALPAMREAGDGRVVNVGYASAEKGLVDPKNFPYFVAKAGVLMFTRMLAADTQDDGVTVNAVSPYVMENSDERPDDAPRGRWARYEDVVQAVLFFLDGGSEYVSGENVEIDGGWLPEDV